MEMYSDKVTVPPVPNPTRSPRVNSSPFSSSPPTRSSSPPGQSPAPSHNSSSKQRPSHPLPTPPAVVLSPCAACKILRRRCVENCVLAPYFPPTEPYKFMIAHRVFGASNIIKFLQELPECQRADAVSSMVYEANARIRDPVYGCTGAICHLQKQVTELQGQLAKAEAELVTIQSQHRNLLSLICMQMTNHHHDDHHHHHDHHEPINILHQYQPQQQFPDSSCNLQLDDYTLGSITWDHEPLWT